MDDSNTSEPPLEQDTLSVSPPPLPEDEVKPWGVGWSLLWTFFVLALWVTAQTITISALAFFTKGISPLDAKAVKAFSKEASTDGDLLGMLGFFPAFAACLMILVIVKIRGAGFQKGLALKAPAGWIWPVTLLATPIILMLLGLLVSPLASDKALQDQAGIVSIIRATEHLPLLLLGVAIGAPFFEEFLFRGLLHTGLRRSLIGVWGSAVVTALAFSALHVQYQDPSAFVLLFLLGLLFTAARELTGSLWVPITMHAIQNLMATLPMFFILNGIVPEDQIPQEIRELIEISEQSSIEKTDPSSGSPASTTDKSIILDR